MAAEKFNNGDSNSSIRAKLNSNADQINANTLGLGSKANKVGGVVPLSELPAVYFSGVTGAGTAADPYRISGGSSPVDLGNYLKSLPNWATDKILQGDLTWVDPPKGEQLEKLATPTLTFATAASDAIPVSWNYVTNGAVYTLQRDSSVTFSNPLNIYSGSANNFLDTGLSASTAYYYRIRVTATGFAGSNYGIGTATTDVPGNVTPAAPTSGVVDDTNNTFNYTPNPTYPANGNYEYTLNGGTTVSDVTAKPIVVGDVSKAVGQVGVRLKAAAGRNASAWLFNGTAFNKLVDNTVPITVWRLDRDIMIDPEMNNTLLYKLPNTVNFGAAYPNLKVLAGGTAILVSEGKVGTAGIGRLAFDNNNDNVMNSGSATYFLGFSDNEYGRQVSTQDYVSYQVPVSVASNLVKIRLRTDATKVYYEYSINGGATWGTLDSKVRANETLYAKVFVEDAYGIRNNNNVRQSGLTAV